MPWSTPSDTRPSCFSPRPPRSTATPEVSPQPESYFGNVNTWGPRACYDEGKRAAEALCYEFQAQGRAEVRVARIFNTYGPGMRLDDGRVMTEFISAALAGRPIRLGEAMATRA